MKVNRVLHLFICVFAARFIISAKLGVKFFQLRVNTNSGRYFLFVKPYGGPSVVSPDYLVFEAFTEIGDHVPE